MDANLQNMLASGAYAEAVELCEKLELDAASDAGNFAYSDVLLACYLILNDLDSARFLWKRAPVTVKANEQFKGLWVIGANMWQRKYAAVYAACDAFNGTEQQRALVMAIAASFRQRTITLIAKAFSSISLAECCELTNLQAPDVLKSWHPLSRQ
eukprot:TRINITY_DN5363_c0_g1_i1.p1 TRINITY_DN5363_c0_g1~~TRINITY_DN5363_c0_g1_i1.p1  ORF type:complete len:163 (+),score=40.65 TRINITY_DN5363_c0_g1_i1:27-491(+)